jgi:hypothetical protein
VTSVLGVINYLVSSSTTFRKLELFPPSDVREEGLPYIYILYSKACECGNEPSGSIKRWEVLEWLHNWQVLKKGSAP